MEPRDELGDETMKMEKRGRQNVMRREVVRQRCQTLCNSDEPGVGAQASTREVLKICPPCLHGGMTKGLGLHVGLIECRRRWRGVRVGRWGSYIHAEFTVQDELKFLIREGAAAQYGLTESREPADTECRAW